jgi:hypothetical protein
MRRGVETIAADVLKIALAWDKDARLIGNVTATELAILAVSAIDTCPLCGATAGVNLDCELCCVISGISEDAQ